MYEKPSEQVDVANYSDATQIPSKFFAKNPELLAKHDYGFLSHSYDEQTVCEKYKELSEKTQYLIDMGVIDGDYNSVYVKGVQRDGRFVDELYIANLRNRSSVVGMLIATKGCQTIIATKKHRYAFANWAEFKEALELDDNLAYELSYTFSESNLIRFRQEQEIYDGIGFNVE